MQEFDLELVDGRTLYAYDPGGGDDHLTVVWHHGTPNIGSPPAPLLESSQRLGIRWVSYDHPGYGGSTRHPGRDLASAAADSSAVADALGVNRFAVMGHSGGGSHALAGGGLLPEASDDRTRPSSRCTHLQALDRGKVPQIASDERQPMLHRSRRDQSIWKPDRALATDPARSFGDGHVDREIRH